jgi:hypothetical protein
MKKQYIFLVIILALCFVQCSLRTSIRPTFNKISILYINNWTINQAAKIATLIKTEKSLDSILVIVNGNVFSSSPLTVLNKGQTEFDILNASQIDAMLFTPEFFNWGTERGKELVRNANFYCLSANIIDKLTNQTFGQEFLYKPFGKSQIAILGVSYDSSNYYFKNKNIVFQKPEFTISKFTPLIKNRTDFQFVLTDTPDTLNFPYDLVLGAPTKSGIQLLPYGEFGIYRIDVDYDNLKNIENIKRKNILLDTITEDSDVKKMILQYQAITDSILHIQYNNIGSNTINNQAINILLTETKSQSYLSNQPLIDYHLSNNNLSFNEFYNALNEKDILPILIVKGKELKLVKKNLAPAISKISDQQDYQILSTINFLKHNPQIKYDSLEFSTLAIWEILSNNLRN